jgi:hypothetical protein
VFKPFFRSEAGGSSRERQPNGSKRSKPIAWAHSGERAKDDSANEEPARPKAENEQARGHLQ